jgi:hypothetical protein
MAAVDRQQLLARGRLLELVTLGWNVVGIIVLAIAAVWARSVALAGFGLDSLIEIGASTVVLWELADVAKKRQLRAMRLIGGAFVALALYLAVQSTVVLVAGFHLRRSALGIVWTAVTAGAMFLLSRGRRGPAQLWKTLCCAPRVESRLSMASWRARCCSVSCSTLHSVGGGPIRLLATSSSTTVLARRGRR